MLQCIAQKRSVSTPWRHKFVGQSWTFLNLSIAWASTEVNVKQSEDLQRVMLMWHMSFYSSLLLIWCKTVLYNVKYICKTAVHLHQDGGGCKWWPHRWRRRLPEDPVWAGKEPLGIGDLNVFNIVTYISISYRQLMTKYANTGFQKHRTFLPQLGGSQPPAGHHFRFQMKPLSWAKP